MCRAQQVGIRVVRLSDRSRNIRLQRSDEIPIVCLQQLHRLRFGKLKLVDLHSLGL
jgi:hypothetical protein